ncbi:ubiquitin-like-conjugating enzyme ATG10 isoform X2 [Magallana gigas]|uniref:ubiquitin-like-conjugating enzyme ATG10 isoform X2 n=1 Tax=Magallana gigas TaxID=29159 RepID=UPI003342A757
MSWHIAVSDTKDGRRFAKKTEVFILSTENKESTMNDDVIRNTELMEEQEEDAAAFQVRGNSDVEVVTYEYHILYSPSYGVPVLYFNAHTQGGKLLALEEIWKRVPDVYKERLSEERWTFITQQEHPLLGRPFYYLHPCHTADLMKNSPVLTDKRHYIVSWLSAVGPVVGLKLPLEYGKLCVS